MYDYDRTAAVKTAFGDSLWAAFGEEFENFVAKLADALLKHMPAGWQVERTTGGAMNQIKTFAEFVNSTTDEHIFMSFSLVKDLHVGGFAALKNGHRGDVHSRVMFDFDSFSSRDNAAHQVGDELKKLFAGQAKV